MGNLFVRLRNLAHMRGDIGQENIIASYISLVEYAEVKNSEWYKSWRGWQDWLLLGWRWVSSGFYMSWIRPLGWLIGGCLVLNAIPFLFFWGEGLSFDFDGYWEFCFLSPTRIPFYADGLNAVLGEDRYGEVLWGIGKGWLNFIGIVRLVWIALCGYAFKNAIKTYWPR